MTCQTKDAKEARGARNDAYHLLRIAKGKLREAGMDYDAECVSMIIKSMKTAAGAEAASELRAKFGGE